LLAFAASQQFERRFDPLVVPALRMAKELVDLEPSELLIRHAP
jgi:hypothetical protein